MPRENVQPQRPLINRLAWFIGLWVLGVVSVGAVGLVIRFALR
jgi:hypothetical protein